MERYGLASDDFVGCKGIDIKKDEELIKKIVSKNGITDSVPHLKYSILDSEKVSN